MMEEGRGMEKRWEKVKEYHKYLDIRVTPTQILADRIW